MRFKSFVLVALIALLAGQVFAAKPTVTIAIDGEYENFRVYEAIWTSAAATADTAVIWKTIATSTPWDISYLSMADSGIAVELESGEVTLDSIRHKLLYQVCYDYTPIASTATTHDEWITFKSTTSDSAAQLSEFFNPWHYGIPMKLRILWIETSTTKDATQSLTLRLVFPKP